ncbi:MAG: hypothetical protein O7G85_16170 [Planctomycetota bacterium]|nr:hypothetical protein [Planctomycetota bacterium]
MRSAKFVLAFSTGIWFAGCTSPSALSPDSGRHIQASCYPSHWWEPVPEAEAASWEVLPQAAAPGEVIVSKRNELGLLSNFSPSPFVYRGRCYPSLEGFWQMMKYPEGLDDPRAKIPGITWKYTRKEVSQMIGT